MTKSYRVIFLIRFADTATMFVQSCKPTKQKGYISRKLIFDGETWVDLEMRGLNAI